MFKGSLIGYKSYKNGRYIIFVIGYDFLELFGVTDKAAEKIYRKKHKLGRRKIKWIFNY